MNRQREMDESDIGAGSAPARTDMDAPSFCRGHSRPSCRNEKEIFDNRGNITPHHQFPFGLLFECPCVENAFPSRASNGSVDEAEKKLVRRTR